MSPLTQNRTAKPPEISARDFSALFIGFGGSPSSDQYALPLVRQHVIALLRARVELTRAPDLLMRILDHFLPLRDPADGARKREQRREHAGREAQRLQRYP